jgi:hypothetical protein
MVSNQAGDLLRLADTILSTPPITAIGIMASPTASSMFVSKPLEVSAPSGRRQSTRATARKCTCVQWPDEWWVGAVGLYTAQ